MSDANTDPVDMFERFIDLYFSSVYSAVARLTGVNDQQALEAITVDVFVDLWKNSDKLFSEVRPPAIVYKILLPHVFAYLKEHQSESRLNLLKNILLIDPDYYEKDPSAAIKDLPD